MGACLFIRYEVLQPLHQNDQDQHGQCKAEVVLQPAGHLEAAAGVALGQVVVKIPAPAGDAEQQLDEAAAGQQYVADEEILEIQHGAASAHGLDKAPGVVAQSAGQAQ